MSARLPTAIRTLSLRANPVPSSQLLQQARLSRTFQSSSRKLQEAVVVPPPRRPVGAFRGTLFGFLLGSVLAGGGLYYYVVDEYKVSNELLTEDIYALQAAVQRIENYVKTLEEEVKTKK